MLGGFPRLFLRRHAGGQANKKHQSGFQVILPAWMGVRLSNGLRSRRRWSLFYGRPLNNFGSSLGAEGCTLATRSSISARRAPWTSRSACRRMRSARSTHSSLRRLSKPAETHNPISDAISRRGGPESAYVGAFGNVRTAALPILSAKRPGQRHDSTECEAGQSEQARPSPVLSIPTM
jgi:hypothetical protein